MEKEGEGGNGADGLTEHLLMRAVVVSLDGKEAVETEMTRRVVSKEEAEQLGKDVAAVLVKQGAGEILDAINKTRVPVVDP